jgi:hypothetical protein
MAIPVEQTVVMGAKDILSGQPVDRAPCINAQIAGVFTARNTSI